MSLQRFFGPPRPQPSTPPDPERLPYVPLTFFYPAMPQRLRVVFVALYALLLLTLAGVLYYQYHPTEAVLQPLVLADTGSAEVVVREATESFRSIPLVAQAQYAFVNYAVGMFGLNVWLVMALALTCAAGWAAVLAASSRIEAWWAYAIYFFVAVWVEASNPGFVFFGLNDNLYVSLALILLLLVPAFLFKQRILVMSMGAQFWLFLAAFGLWFGIGFLRLGMAGVHQLAGFTWPVLVAVLVLFLIVFSRELLNLVLAAGLLHRDEQRRQPLGRLLVPLLLIAVLELLLLLQHMGYLPDTDMWVQPSHLFVLTAAGGVFTIMNVYGLVQHQVSSSGTFVLLMLGMAVLAGGTTLYGFATGEVMFRALFDRDVLLVFSVFHLLYLAYLLIHFLPLLRRRANIYFGLMRPPRPSALGYVVVWFLGLSFLIVVEGGSRWRTVNLARVTFFNIWADNELFKDSPESATTLYRVALDHAQRDHKANLNLGALSLRNDPDIDGLAALYQNAERYQPFPYARVTYGNLLRARGQLRKAIRFLQWLPAAPDALVQNNLAAAYRAAGQPDSAVLALKAALQIDPRLAPAYANLALVYAESQRPAEAAAFLREAAALAPGNPYVRQNAAYFALRADSLRNLAPDVRLPSAADTNSPTGLRLNLALLALRNGDAATAERIAGSLSSDGFELTDALLVRVISQAAQDSLELAASRYDYLRQQSLPQAALAAHALGVAYFERGVPEMAADYFLQAAAQGRVQDSLYAAYMLADAGDADAAVRMLDRLRTYQPAYWTAAKRESAILLRAYGAVDQAVAEWDFADMTLAEGLRLARTAGRAARPDLAADILAQLVARDSSNRAPFLEMGRVYLDLGLDSLAVDNLREGLKYPRIPDSLLTRFQAALAQAYARMGRIPQAEAALRAAPDTAALPLQVARAETLLAAGKLPQAQALLLQLHRRHPLHVPATALLARTYLAQRDYLTGLQMMDASLRRNSRNYTLWLWQARLAAAIRNDADAAYAARVAAELARSPRELEAVQTEFAALLNANPPEGQVPIQVQ